MGTTLLRPLFLYSKQIGSLVTSLLSNLTNPTNSLLRSKCHGPTVVIVMRFHFKYLSCYMNVHNPILLLQKNCHKKNCLPMDGPGYNVDYLLNNC